MLDSYIIDAIRREEQARQRELEEGRRIQLEIPIAPPHHPDEPGHDRGREDESADRGVVIIPLYPNEDAEDAA